MQKLYILGLGLLVQACNLAIPLPDLGQQRPAGSTPQAPAAVGQAAPQPAQAEGKQESPPPLAPVRAAAPVQRIDVFPERLVLEVGSTQAATATVVYQDNTRDSNVDWSSSDSTIASVNPTTGEVTPLKPGEVTIVAVAKIDNARRAGLQVSVRDSATVVALVEVAPDKLTLKRGETASVQAVVRTSAGTRAPHLKFSSTNTSVAVVKTSGANGLITAVGAGKAEILVVADNDPTRSAKVSVDVSE